MTKKKKLSREENYKKNIEAIKEAGLVIYEKLKEEPSPPSWAEPIKSKNGDPNLIVKGIQNDVKPAYELDKPRKVPRQVVKNYCLYKETATVLIGVGAGHILKQIIAKKEEKHVVIVAEPEPFLINYTLHNYDFSKWILNGTLLFAMDKEEAVNLIKFIDTMIVIQDWGVINEGYTLARVYEYGEIIHYVFEIINQIKCNTGTVEGAGSVIADNDIINMPYIIKCRGVEELKDLYKGKPAVTINTGPSLKKNLYLLLDKEYRKKVVVIAVAQALRLLLAYGIKPDFITTVDYGPVNQTHFDGLMDCDVPLVCLNRTYATILKRYKGSKFVVVSEQPGYPMSAVKLMEKKGQIVQGGSVSHLSLGLAIHLGCNPITITGQDLSYGETLERSHTDGADSSGKLKIENGLLVWEVDDPNSDLLNKDKQIMGIPQYVEGYMGRLVITNVGLLSFITSFQNIVHAFPDVKFYNSTEGGARIKGMKQISLRKFLEDFCKEEIPISKMKKFEGFCEDWEELIKKALPMLNSEIEILEELASNCKKGMKCGEKMLENPSEKEMLKLMEDNMTYSTKAHELSRQMQLIAISVLKENRQIHNRKYKIDKQDLHLEENKRKLKIRVEANKLILSSVLKSSERLIPLYKKTRDRLKQYVKTKDESLLSENKDVVMKLEDCEEYFKTGNWAWPMVTAYKQLGVYPVEMDENFIYNKSEQSELAGIHKIIHKATEMKNKEIEKAKNEPDRQKEIEYNELVYDAITEGRNNKNFNKALSLLKEAVEVFPEKEIARWGLATALAKTGKIEEAEEIYKKLVEDFPKNHRYKFEYGITVMKVDVDRGIKLVTEAQAESTNYDYMFDVFGDIYVEMAHKIVREKGRALKTIPFDENIEKAMIAYEEYLKKYPANIITMEKLRKCYVVSGDLEKEKELSNKIKRMKIN